MRLRIRTLLLTVALLCGLTSTASACLLPPCLNPFCWLFGCGYGYGGYGYGYDYGYGGGYAANPYADYRVIDDWLGYGYLRNQQGTLGHYPGRPFGCYQPWFPGLFDPCPPPAPAFAMPGPMVAPLPMPAMPNPYGDPCQNQYADPCMPMVQCQPAPVPVTTWTPVTVDRGNWQMVWVPRPVTTMVPQTQYITPPPMMNTGCGDDCYGDSEGMMQGAMPGMSSDDGCCGSDGMMQQGLPSAGPQSSMMYPGSMTAPPQYAALPYTSMYGQNSSMYGQPPLSGTMPWSPMGPSAMGAYPVSAYNNPYAFRQMPRRFVRREIRRSAREYRHFNAPFNPAAWPYPAQQATGWSQPMVPQAAYSQPIYSQPAYGQQIYGQPVNTQQPYSQPQQYSLSASPMTAQRAPQSWSSAPPQTGWTMQGTASPGMNVAGDVMGDHEFSPATTAAIPMVPNSFSGPTPFMRANLSRPVQTMSASRYPNVVR